MATFYTDVDKERYDAGEKFLPLNRFLLNYTAPTENVEEKVTTSVGLPATKAFINSGGGGTFYSPDQKMADFNKAIAERQNRLENPGWIQQKFSDLTGIQQRPVSEMGFTQYNPKFTRSYSDGMTSFGLPFEGSGEGAFGEMPVVPKLDERLIGKIPLGIGSMISKALPDKYYSDFTVPEQVITQMYMGYTDPTTGMSNKDPFGINVRSALGNYAEYATNAVTDTNKALEESAKKRGLTWDAETGTIIGADENDEAYKDFMSKTNNLRQRNKYYRGVDFNYQKAKDNYAVAKKQRAAWEKETAREQDEADKRFTGPHGTGDYDEYAGAGGTPTFTIHDPSTTAEGYSYEGSDEQDKDNEYSGGSNMGATQHGSSGMTKDQHAAFRAATGGRVGFQEGGGIESRLKQLGGDVTSAEQTLQELNDRLKSAGSSIPEGGIGTLAAYTPPNPAGGYQPALPDTGFANEIAVPSMGGTPTFTPLPEGLPTTPNPNLLRPGATAQPINFFNADLPDKLIPIDPYRNTQLAGLSQDGQRFDSAQSAWDSLADWTRKAREASPHTRDVIGTELYQGKKGFENFTNYFNQVNDPSYTAPSLQLASSQQNLQKAFPGSLYADGGRVYLNLGGLASIL